MDRHLDNLINNLQRVAVSLHADAERIEYFITSLQELKDYDGKRGGLAGNVNHIVFSVLNNSSYIISAYSSAIYNAMEWDNGR